MTNIFRQGDVVLVEVAGIPEGVVKYRTELRESGETGNAHILSGVDVYKGIDRTMREPIIQQWVNVGEGGVVMVHSEHPSLTIPKGNYLLRKVRTFTFDRIREVED